MKKTAFILAFCGLCGTAAAQTDSIAAASQPMNAQAAQDTLAAANAERQPYCKYKTASYGQAKAMAFLMQRETSDNKRLKLGKKYIDNYLLTVEQLGWLADTFADGGKRAKFLKKAQDHCSDQENYEALLAK